MLRRPRRSDLCGLPPDYVDWPPEPRRAKRKALTTVTCPHCEREFELEPYRPGIRHAGEACDKIRQETRGKLQESFWVLYLNNRNRVAGKTEICHGTGNMCVVHPRDVFREAVTRNASGIIVAHNHPSGNALPSEEDIALTERLVAAGKVVGVPVLDHVVVSEMGCYSIRSDGKVKF